MSTNPIYVPTGKAKEYGDLAINIYTGCPHRCFYCFAPGVLRKDKENFHTHVEPKKDIVERVRRQIEREGIKDKLIHLCFTCDPYPTGYDSTPTREIIKIIKESGNHVQILTKGDGTRDFNLLDAEDWYGVSFTGKVVGTPNTGIFEHLEKARCRGIKTWVSFEPVLDAVGVYEQIRILAHNNLADKIKIGKLNYYPSEINWKVFGKGVEALCQRLGMDYYIKESLRKEMEKR